MPLWLTESDVRASLDVPALIGAMESALSELAGGEAVQPVRTAIDIAERSFFGVMPVFAERRGVLGAKLLTVVPANADRGLDTHLAAICLFHAVTGELLAVMDGRYITEMRTAAVSAISVRYLARTEPHILAILGSGVQARSHRKVLAHVMECDEIRVWSPTAANLHRFVAEDGPACRPAQSAEQAVRGADVVLVATNSPVPVLRSDWVGEGTHVIAIGACRPSQREVDPALMARARVVVDSRAAALQEAGDVILCVREGWFSPDHVTVELGQIVRRDQPGRTSPDEVTLFKSLGLAIEDLVAADLVYHKAIALGLGTTLSLS